MKKDQTKLLIVELSQLATNCHDLSLDDIVKTHETLAFNSSLRDLKKYISKHLLWIVTIEAIFVGCLIIFQGIGRIPHTNFQFKADYYILRIFIAGFVLHAWYCFSKILDHYFVSSKKGFWGEFFDFLRGFKKNHPATNGQVNLD